MLNYFYSDSISSFLQKEVETIIGEITLNGRFSNTLPQLDAWQYQIVTLKEVLRDFEGNVFFEFSIPRMGKRVDCLLIVKNIVFVIEFKVGEKKFNNYDIEQVWDYALDLKNFHKPSHDLLLVPILVASHARSVPVEFVTTSHEDNLCNPVRCNVKNLRETILQINDFFIEGESINAVEYLNGSYTPTPTIIEAAIRLYNNHNVEEITRSDADAINLNITSRYVSSTIDYARENNKKVICFVTGVPGAGKTLVGLKVAIEHLDKAKGDSSVFLSGNKPLVDVLQEALAMDKYAQEKAANRKITKKEARQSVKAFIQIIHHYRDLYIRDQSAPFDHVAIFDEAQRAWTKEQTVKFMAQKKNIPNFGFSEPEFLISCLDRHKDWAVVICLVGGGQEINTGEAGISEWLTAVGNRFSNWEVRISPKLHDHEYNATEQVNNLARTRNITFNDDLHLAVSLRSFRAEKLSLFVKELLDRQIDSAQETLQIIQQKYPIVITRDLQKAKSWLKEKARGSQRYGIVVSSQAYRLKPLAMDVRTPINHVYWFLNGKHDVRSSYFLEDVATEFQVQGLELDWVCVTWDADLRYSEQGWETHSFKGNSWQKIRKEIRIKYLINAYRVLLTRARQGMVIVVPKGDLEDHTRLPEFYDSTFEYFKTLGLEEI